MIFLYAFLTFILLFILLVAFKPLWVMNHFAFSLKVKRFKNLAYVGVDCQHERHTLDLYVPQKWDKNKPILVFIHGGSWDEGHKNDYEFAGSALANLGYITAVMNYRLYPQVQFPSFIEDMAAAIASLPDHLSQLDLPAFTPLNIVLMGHSAGAHSAAMLAAKPEYLMKANAQVNVRAFIGLAGPYDLPLDDPLVIGKFDGIELHPADKAVAHNRHDANPINLAQSSMPNTLLIHGAKDDTVGPYHSEHFKERLDQLKVDCEHVVYAKADHRTLVGALSIYGRFLNPVYADIARYLKHLK